MTNIEPRAAKVINIFLSGYRISEWMREKN